MAITWVKGLDFKPYYPLLLEADPNLDFVKNYLKTSYVALYYIEEEVCGLLVLKPQDTTFEIMNLSVKESFQGKKIAQELLKEAIYFARLLGGKKLFIATGTTGSLQLYLYQKMGFRFYEINRDFFTLNYPKIIENNLLLQDQIVLDLDLTARPFSDEIRPLKETDEIAYKEFLKDIIEFDQENPFSKEMIKRLKLQENIPFSDILQKEKDNLHPTKKDLVPQMNYYLFQNNHIAGQVSIRLFLTEKLAKTGGHIGYYLAPSFRNRHLGQYLLAFALKNAPEERLLILAYENNLASRKLIENFGGKYLATYPTTSFPLISYEINTEHKKA